MSSFDKTRALMALLISCALPGCYDSFLCGEPETCDRADNDCDRRIDEDFLDESGRYVSAEHCGGCGVACADVFPTAANTACEVIEDEARCVLVACAEGFHRAGDGACAPDVPALCLACGEDSDCTLRQPGASCRTMPSGEGRCLSPCAEEVCPPGFFCDAGLCAPATGLCACTGETVGLEFACLVERDDGLSCAGAQACTEDGLGACEPALDEACNGQDDDCDGGVDEDYRSEDGRYVARLHCGACASPCVEPGPNMVAQCLPDGPVPGVTCVIECAEGFVDVDGIDANGCECERFDGSGPPPVVGGDGDCDGLPDETDDFIYVTATGSDSNPGTLERPMRSLQNAAERGRTEGKSVLVARGVYDGRFDVVPGVSVFGGYRGDFRDRDLALFPVVLENTEGAGGAPVLECHDVRVATRIEGFTIQGSDATRPGDGSTAVYLDGCSSDVRLASLTVFAGRGGDGVRGQSSSDVYAGLGGAGLEELDGLPGTEGSPGTSSGTCTRVSAGRGGERTCRLSRRRVSGGNGGDADCPFNGCINGSPCGNAGCTDFTRGGVCDLDAARAAAAANPPAFPGAGTAPGEAGDSTYNAPTNRGVCNFCDDNPTLPRTGVRGGDGAAGVDGIGGDGCSARPAFEPVTGIVRGGGGTNGTAGTDGSGGGGGSPGSGYSVIGATGPGCMDRSGGSGGGGGSGGCGAPAATGGSGGGTSTGVVIRLGAGDTQGPALEEVRIVTASGGVGGDGGIGAGGGSAGPGANGGMPRFWCSRTGGRGGDGGRGGAAGGGGGGCGGGTHAVFVVGSGDADYVRELGELPLDLVGVPGRGGSGGFSAVDSGDDGGSGSNAAVFVSL